MPRAKEEAPLPHPSAQVARPRRLCRAKRTLLHGVCFGSSSSASKLESLTQFPQMLPVSISTPSAWPIPLSQPQGRIVSSRLDCDAHTRSPSRGTESHMHNITHFHLTASRTGRSARISTWRPSHRLHRPETRHITNILHTGGCFPISFAMRHVDDSFGA